MFAQAAPVLAAFGQSLAGESSAGPTSYGDSKRAATLYCTAHRALLGEVGPFASWPSSARLHLDDFVLDPFPRPDGPGNTDGGSGSGRRT